MAELFEKGAPFLAGGKAPEAPTVRGMQDYLRMGAEAELDALAKGSSVARKRQEEIANRQTAIDEERNRREQQREEDRAKRLADKQFDTWWDDFQDSVSEELASVDKFKPEKGGLGKPEKEAAISTGFVGVAEFAKQFQAASLKSESERYQRETADNTKRMAEGIDEIKDREDEGVFD
jgi:hypothetical protein